MQPKNITLFRFSFIIGTFFSKDTHRALVIQPRTANSQIKALPLLPVPSSGPKGSSNPFGSQQKHINDVKVDMGKQGEEAVKFDT